MTHPKKSVDRHVASDIASLGLVAQERPLVWIHGEVKSPPFSRAARIEAGVLLRRLQRGETLSLPLSRPMPAIGGNCHELRIVDQRVTWRLVIGLEPDAVVILDVFAKKTARTPDRVVRNCRRRLAAYRAVG